MLRHGSDRLTSVHVAGIMLSLAIMSLTGCASKDVKDEGKAAVEERKPVAEAPKPAVVPPPTAQRPEAKPSTSAKIAAKPIDPFSDPKNPLSKASVYFDYDQDVIKDEYKPIVQAHAKYLSEHRSGSVVIEGNADERGSREYNIGLGQRRADAVRRMMVLLGAAEKQIETVSFGEEKPVCEQHEESCWWRNRHADVKYRAK